MDSDQAPNSGVQVGPFQLVQEVARGGMGVVYRGSDPAGRPVAVKVLSSFRSVHARERFMREVQALSRLDHPNVVRIVGSGEEHGAMWLALEFIEGETLQSRLVQGPLPVWEAIGLVDQLAGAVDYVHSQDLLHRDLKPDNVLLRGRQVMLTDFGLVLDEDSSAARLTQTGVFSGTPGYWSPEQAEGRVKEFGPRTDVYGLGAVLYACLTGRSPVRSDSLQDLLLSTSFAITPPRELRPEIPTWLSVLCMRCLAREPADRPESAAEVSEALAAAGQGAEAPRARASWVVGAAFALVVGGVGLGYALSGEREAPSNPEPPQPEQREPAQPETRQPDPTPNDTIDPVNAHIVAGLEHAEASRYVEALVEFERALQLKPGFAKALAWRGHSKARLGQMEAALVDFNAAIDGGHLKVRVFTDRAEALAALGRVDEALEDFSYTLTLNPDDVVARLNRAECLRALQRLPEALEDYTQVLATYPDNAQALIGRASISSAQGKRTSALRDLDRALELEPEDADARLWRGRVKLNLGRYAEALPDLELAVKLEGTAVAYAHLGQAKRRVGRVEESLATLSKAVELDPNYEWAVRMRAMAYHELGRFEESLADYDRCRELAPERLDGYRGRAVALLQLMRFDEAMLDCERVLELGGQAEFDFMNLGVCFERLERYEDAIKAYDRALELYPKSALTLANRGASLVRLERPEEALKDFDRSLELNPNDPHTHSGRGNALKDMERYDEALVAYTLALELNPTYGPGYADRGRTYARLGRDAEALADYDRALQHGLPKVGQELLQTWREELKAKLEGARSDD